MPEKRATEKRVFIGAPEVVSYLKRLAQLGVYGRKPGAVATWIVRKEIARLLERHVLNPIEFVSVEKEGEDEDEDEADS